MSWKLLLEESHEVALFLYGENSYRHYAQFVQLYKNNEFFLHFLKSVLKSSRGEEAVRIRGYFFLVLILEAFFVDKLKSRSRPLAGKS